MKLKALESFTCFPDGDDKPGKSFEVGQEFEIANSDYAELLILKGHAEEVAGE